MLAELIGEALNFFCANNTTRAFVLACPHATIEHDAVSMPSRGAGTAWLPGIE